MSSSSCVREGLCDGGLGDIHSIVRIQWVEMQGRYVVENADTVQKTCLATTREISRWDKTVEKNAYKSPSKMGD